MIITVVIIMLTAPAASYIIQNDSFEAGSGGFTQDTANLRDTEFKDAQPLTTPPNIITDFNSKMQQLSPVSPTGTPASTTSDSNSAMDSHDINSLNAPPEVTNTEVCSKSLGVGVAFLAVALFLLVLWHMRYALGDRIPCIGAVTGNSPRRAWDSFSQSNRIVRTRVPRIGAVAAGPWSAPSIEMVELRGRAVGGRSLETEC